MEIVSPTEKVLLAFAVTLFAGLATGIGSAVAFFARRTNYRFLAASLGFSAGVMLYVSFVEILRKSEQSLALIHGPAAGAWMAAASFFAGMLLIGLVDRFVPTEGNLHRLRELDDLSTRTDATPQHTTPGPRMSSDKLLRMGLLSATAIAIHNFPEGLATFFLVLDNPKVGVAIALAIAIHNIPEGISVSVPIYYATNDRAKAFGLSFLTGLAEPAGAVIGYFVLRPIMTPSVIGMVFGAVAGIMVYISLDELLPTAREYSKGHEVLYGIVLGMAVMALSLVLLK